MTNSADAERESWLHGWPRIGEAGVLIGTGVHCVGCGRSLGITTVVLDDRPYPDRYPEWPFAEQGCPVHRKPDSEQETEQESDPLVARGSGVYGRLQEAQATIQQQAGEIEHMRQQNAVLLETLKKIEWSNLQRAGACDDVEAPVFEYCPWCKVTREAGHDAGCIVGTVLAQPVQAKTDAAGRPRPADTWLGGVD